MLYLLVRCKEYFRHITATLYIIKPKFFCIYFSSLYLCIQEDSLFMSKEQSNIIEYLVCVIGAFAKRFSMTNANSYEYLRKYKGLDFLTKHYAVEHTQSIEDAVDDLAIVCSRHGGVLSL